MLSDGEMNASIQLKQTIIKEEEKEMKKRTEL
jgi:hypothetical protein